MSETEDVAGVAVKGGEDGKRRILVSFSMGRTSGYMLKRLLDEYRDDPAVELLAICANSTQEDPRSLVFGAACNRAWNAGVVVVEADVIPALGVGTGHRVVSFETADTSGRVFEQMVAKFGIPNADYPHCNRELKLRPIQSYARSIGWGLGTYETAIGIRADEIDRMSETADEDHIIYPLVKWGVTKDDVIRWWRQQPFDLELPGEQYGNCTWCWKKTLRKHLTLAVDAPDVFAFPARMERLYPFAGRGEGPRRFFRQHWTTLDIAARARQPFERWVDGVVHDDPELDRSNGCDEACNIFPAKKRGQIDMFEDAA